MLWWRRASMTNGSFWTIDDSHSPAIFPCAERALCLCSIIQASGAFYTISQADLEFAKGVQSPPYESAFSGAGWIYESVKGEGPIFAIYSIGGPLGGHFLRQCNGCRFDNWLFFKITPCPTYRRR